MLLDMKFRCQNQSSRTHGYTSLARADSVYQPTKAYRRAGLELPHRFALETVARFSPNPLWTLQNHCLCRIRQEAILRALQSALCSTCSPLSCPDHLSARSAPLSIAICVRRHVNRTPTHSRSLGARGVLGCRLHDIGQGSWVHPGS